ncbi:ROK family transcriptional regulator [Solihabitans fulvus]|uniref:ROK family transcriptional regulator n=1 Tax=Solihabitans fulvus TaxID=1892852 RepID=A0A5B2X4A8_9PSEU|nr:ROK family transcriptional regulator [Solihabitans fulvus]KAA2258147.1 ROK family transcriptional regulator [Solihabitans fulvus]
MAKPRAAVKTSLLRRINAGLVLELLRDVGSLTVTEVAERAELSRPTVDAVADDLVRLGLVAEAWQEERRRGRPARRLAFRPEAGHVLAIDVFDEGVRVFVADLAGRVVARAERPVGRTVGRPERIAEMHAAVADVLGRAAMSIDDVLSIGAATPGTVDVATGTVNYCAAMPDWTGLELRTLLESTYGRRAAVGNDANLAVIGERWRGSATAVDDVVFLIAGYHAGAGIIVGGHPVQGFGGGAGELGFLGLWEEVDVRAHSALALQTTEIVAELVEQSAPCAAGSADWRDTHDPSTGQVDTAAVLAAARHGDTEAVQVLQRFLARTSYAIAIVALVLNPELIVVGGAIAKVGDQLLEPLSKLVRLMTANMVLTPPRVVLSALGTNAVGTGALRRALDLVEQRWLDELGDPVAVAEP